MTEIRSANLRFTEGEAAAFLNELKGLDIPPESVAALEARTEGWIAGLHLAALSIQGRNDNQSFIDAFTGNERHIVDYLTDEVLSLQTEEVKDFLLQTSILNRLSGPLCDSVTGQSNGQRILEQLESANLFVVSLDDERGWYRYHHLFGNMLRHHLDRDTAVEGVSLLHQRAYDWFLQNGLTEEALGHALAAKDYDRAARLIEQNAGTMIRRGDVGTVLRWLKSLPAEVLRASPRLSLDYARVLISNLQMSEIEPHLQDAEDALRGKPDSEMRGEIDAFHALLTRVRGDASLAIELHNQALTRISENNLDIRSFITRDLGWGYVAIDDIDSASKAFAESSNLSQENSNILIAMYAICGLAEVHVSQGRLHQAVATYHQALQVASEGSERGAPTSLSAGLAHGGLAQLYREWNNLDLATEHALKAIELGELGGPKDNLLLGYLTLGLIEQARGNYTASFEELQEAEQIARDSKIPQRITAVAAYKARLWLMQVRMERNCKC